MPIDSVRLSANELSQLLDEMDRQSETPRLTKRKHERIAFRCMGLVVMVDQNGFLSKLAVPTRNISCGGVAFLHRAMIHVGSPCQVRIRAPGNRWLKTSGQVVRSRYIRTGICEIGLKFDSEIDIGLFAEPDVAPE